MYKIIYLRDEYLDNEYRTPLVPKDIKKLIDIGFQIYIQKSNKRIYSNSDYRLISNKIIFTENPWYDDKYKNILIIGLKKFENIEKLNGHKHLYFSHTYKNQYGSKEILNFFYKSKSILYDFEYFLNNDNKRIISFGFYAGIIGCILGLLQYFTRKIYNNEITDLNPWNSEYDMINIVNTFKDEFSKINIGIIGHNGNCGSGVIYILNKLNICYYGIDRNKNVNYSDFDIFYNCILLKPENTNIFFNSQTIFKKQITIVDISCDCDQKNNPIQLYNKCTTWENPVFKYNEYVDIIAINNLPSLLPKDSSNYFSNKCVELLMNMDSEYWKKCEKEFYINIEKKCM